VRNIDEFTQEVYRRAEVKKQKIKHRNKIIKNSVTSCCCLILVFTAIIFIKPAVTSKNSDNATYDIVNETAKENKNCSIDYAYVTTKPTVSNKVNFNVKIIKNQNEFKDYINSSNALTASDASELTLIYDNDYFNQNFLVIFFTNYVSEGDEFSVTEKLDGNTLNISIQNDNDKESDSYTFILLEYDKDIYPCDNVTVKFIS